MHQQPVAELPACLLQSAVGLEPDDTVDEESAILLELPNSFVQAGIEQLGIGTVELGQAQHRQPRPDVGDAGGAVPGAEHGVDRARTRPDFGHVTLQRS